MLVLVLIGCGAPREPVAELRIDRVGPDASWGSWCPVKPTLVSTYPDRIRPEARADIRAAIARTAESLGLPRDDENPDLLILTYRETFDNIASYPRTVTVEYEWKGAIHRYTYQHDLRPYPEGEVGVLVVDILRTSDGALRRQLVLPYFFSDRRMAQRDGPEGVPRSFMFPLATLVAKAGGAGASAEPVADSDNEGP